MQVMFATTTRTLDGSPAVYSRGRSETPNTITFEDDASENQVRPGEGITFLYRAAEGLSLESHAAKCAEICGVPTRIVTRAQHVSNMLSRHEITQLLDEGMTEKERLDLENAEHVCRQFLAWNIQDDDGEDVKGKLARVLGRNDDDWV
ncbi:hypothetical protein PM082_017331 [Marasmius tenuissimus]|nr:hypothetical protein PM082_017331 [Marasmius tenuissimus]